MSHLARLLASQMTTAGIGIGAQIKNVQPQLQVCYCRVQLFERLLYMYVRTHVHMDYMFR